MSPTLTALGCHFKSVLGRARLPIPEAKRGLTGPASRPHGRSKYVMHTAAAQEDPKQMQIGKIVWDVNGSRNVLSFSQQRKIYENLIILINTIAPIVETTHLSFTMVYFVVRLCWFPLYTTRYNIKHHLLEPQSTLPNKYISKNGTF